MTAIVVGRAFRFLLEGFFAVRYGQEAKVILARYYPWIGLGLAVGILLFVVLRRFLKREVKEVVEELADASTGDPVAERGLEAGN